MLKQDFTKDYEYLVKRIFKDKKPTAFARFNEGEYFLMNGWHFIWAGSLWRTISNIHLLQDDLMKTLKYDDEWFIFWIATRQHLRANIFYKRNIESKNKTFATIFVNNNYKKFREVLANIKEEVILVANKVWENRNYPFKVKKFFWVPFNVVSFYEKNKEEVLCMCDDICKFKNKLVLVCAWPLANIIVYECWKRNKTNRYIDIGSTLDEYIMNRPTRQYFFENWKTHNQIDYL